MNRRHECESMDPTLEEVLHDVEELCEAAARGPWFPTDKPNDACCWTHHVEIRPANPRFEGDAIPIADVGGEPAAKFIAAARTDVPALLRVIETFRNRCETLMRKLYDEECVKGGARFGQRIEQVSIDEMIKRQMADLDQEALDAGWPRAPGAVETKETNS